MLEENETRARSDQGAGEVDARALSRLLRAEVSDGNPDAFGENVEVLLSLAMEGGEEAPLSVAEIKTLLRHLARRFEERSGNRIFSLGVYQTFFPWIRARRSSSGPGGSMGEGLENPLGLLAQICSLLRNEALTVQTLRPILLRLWGQLCEGIPAREAGLPDGRMLAWRLFEAILRGLLSVETFSTAERSFHYGVLCPSSRLEAALQDERRQVLLADFRFAVGDLFPRGPSLTALIRNSTALSPSDRALLIGSICARGPRDVEPFSHLLRHHGFLVAHVEEDLREPYFELVDSLLGHILEAVLSDGRDERTSVLRVYLTILRESYLPRLARYSGVLREARAGAELFADLLLEPYLARMGVLDGSREPSLLGLIEDWTALQQVLERQQGYKGAPFSLADGLLEWERRWMEFRGQASVSSPLEDGGPLTQTSEVGRAEGRARRRTLSDYGTFLRLPVQPPPSEPELEAAIGQGAAAADPFGEEAVTDPFGVPKMGPELFDAVTRRLPVLDAALLDSSGGLTLLEPSALGRAGALHRAATIILPVSASGEPDEGLHQASTLIFPVQSVPVSRNEAICRRVDVLLASDRDRSQRPSERLRSELLLMQDGDRIIAEQYLAQSVEREMAGISRRLEAARGMSNVTLDDFAGAMLSTVLRDYVVTGYLRRVFVAECVGLYGRFLRREPPEQTVTDSLQLALFTVLNAHQERLRLPLEVEAELVLLAALPQGQPLPTRLPYHHPGPLVLPPDLSARVARTGSWQLVFDAEHLLVSHMQELERFVQGVSSLGIFADLEAALGASGFGPAPYLAFCAELRSRIYKIVERFRRLFLRLDEAGAESAAIEGSFLELIAYGRAVWSGSLLPALGFYAKMAFGLREGDQGFGSALDRQAGQSLK